VLHGRSAAVDEEFIQVWSEDFWRGVGLPELWAQIVYGDQKNVGALGGNREREHSNTAKDRGHRCCELR
jgi:hypothetical protein